LTFSEPPAFRPGEVQDTGFIVGADHGFTSVYWEINIRPTVAESGLTASDQPKLDRFVERLQKNPHIMKIYKSADFPSLGLQRFEDSTRVRGQYLVVADPDTYLVEAPDDSTELRLRRHPAHGHGTCPAHPKMYPMLVLEGPGLKKGARIGHVHNVDVAPTICKLLHLAPLDFDGRVLTEALAK
jgi:hypothetical protein